MKKQPLDYHTITRGDTPTSQVRFQTIVSWSLLGLAALSALVALVWPRHRAELFGAAISLGAAAAIVHLPYRRM